MAEAIDQPQVDAAVAMANAVDAAAQLPVMQQQMQPNVAAASAAAAATRRKPAKFVVQLYKMIAEDGELVRWQGGNIIMPNPNALKVKASCAAHTPAASAMPLALSPLSRAIRWSPSPFVL
jgi:hypothetical protein